MLIAQPVPVMDRCSDQASSVSCGSRDILGKLSFTGSPDAVTRASGGIGRRAGFRCQCPKGRGGSTPPSRTDRTCERSRSEVKPPTGFFVSVPVRALSSRDRRWPPTEPTRVAPFGAARSACSVRVRVPALEVQLRGGCGVFEAVSVLVTPATGPTAVIEPWSILIGPAMGVVIGTGAGLYPALKATRIQPVEAFGR